jgi:endonuclease YncB( thermonuclease family)/predicted flap endonuclease-1-like 5' DNA nuclease
MKRRSSITIFRLWVLALFLFVWPITTCVARGPWTTLENCRYLVKRANDGDSFHVSVGGKEYIFRLYFVDAPETDSEFPDRIKVQARYFGLADDQTLNLGELAKAFTREKLSRPFIVRTRWQDAMGRSRMQRFYAFVQTYNGDLGEQLVEHGLARRYGAAAKPSELSSSQQEWQKLANLEEKAKQEKVGGWAIKEGLPPTRSKEAESEKGIDPFDAFFHPQKVATAKTTGTPGPTASPASSPRRSGSDKSDAPARLTSHRFPAEAKLDINNASQTELEDIPGIGPALAKRIMAARPFKTADDLRNVKGIGSKKKYEKVRPYFR